MDSSTESEGPVLSVQERSEQIAVKARGKSKGPNKKRKVDQIEEDPEKKNRLEEDKKFYEELRRREKVKERLKNEHYEAGLRHFQTYQDKVDAAPEDKQPDFPTDLKSRIALFKYYLGNIQEATCPACNIAKISITQTRYNNTPSFQAGHIFPKSKGGTNNFDNVIPICSHCNSECGIKHLYFYAFKEWRVDLVAWIENRRNYR